jgi:hypothetical protein
MQGAKLENMVSSEDHRSTCSAVQHLSTQQDPSSVAGTTIFCDAAWKIEKNMESTPAGIGIIITTDCNQHYKQLHVSALSPPASSPLQAEAFGLLLATMLAERLSIQEPTYFTDCLALALEVGATSIFNTKGHWIIRPLLAAIQESSAFQDDKIAHANRCYNVKAHHQAQLALKIQSRPLAIRCLS